MSDTDPAKPVPLGEALTKMIIGPEAWDRQQERIKMEDERAKLELAKAEAETVMQRRLRVIGEIAVSIMLLCAIAVLLMCTIALGRVIL